MKSCVTINLVPEVTQGPFIFSGPLKNAVADARSLGFDAIEIFAPDAGKLRRNLAEARLDNNTALAAIGTGAGWVLHQWSLSSLDNTTRDQALRFVESFVELAADIGGKVIIGSIQGHATATDDRGARLQRLADSLQLLQQRAAVLGVTLLLEPLNRTESNLLNRLSETQEFLFAHALCRVELLADLYHLRMEEVSVSQAILAAGSRIGHVHFVGPQRLPVTIDDPIIPGVLTALRQISYEGYLSVEANPVPDPVTAARQALFAHHFFTKRCQVPLSGIG